MKTALINTTINVPHVLKLYRKLDPDVRFFVAGDTKTPHHEVSELCNSLGNARYITPAAQQRWKCSEPTGWGCIQRRNIALLEAVEWGADIIYTMDDDNIPMDRAHFINIAHAFDDFHGPMGESKVNNNWLDPGQLLMPPYGVRQRGVPHDIKTNCRVVAVVDAKVGVVAGACLGDPDIDAVTRIATRPEIHNVSELLRSGIVVEPRTRTIFNSQNTAFLLELAPTMFMLPNVGRFDDIYASLICQRIMRTRNLHVHHGKPFVWQTRNEHDLLQDLQQEIDGMSRIRGFAENLDEMESIADQGTVKQTKYIWKCLEGFFPARTSEAAQAFLEDIESVM